MTDVCNAAGAAPIRWTCPFCPLLCDDLRVRADASGSAFELVEGECAAARAALAQYPATPSQATCTVEGEPCDAATAIAAAGRVLAASRQPLFGGLATDVAGARALVRLAAASGAICDAARGEALMQGVRALQDRGGFTTTLAEVRARADVIVCVGGLPTSDFFARCLASGSGRDAAPAPAQRHVALLGGSEDDAVALATWAESDAGAGVQVEAIALHADLHASAALLAAALAARAARDVPQPIAALARRLLEARYGVIVFDASRLPAQGALLIETLNRCVATLNARTRAAALWLDSGVAAATVNQVFTWMSGLPLRSRAGPLGLEHDPLGFDAVRLLRDAAVDSLLWVSSFDASCAPPPTGLPLIVLGHPALAAAAARPQAVFIPVATPGIGCAGHLFRADGVLLPLTALYRDRLPGVADVAGELTHALHAARRHRGGVAA